MAVGLFLFSLIALLYGLFDPDGVLPTALGHPSRGKVLAVYGGLLLLTGVSMGPETAEPPSNVQIAGDFDAEREVVAPDLWPGGAAARDSTFTQLASLISASRFAEVQDQARALAAEPYAAEWADSLRSIGNQAEEEAMYAQAQSLPGSELERNRDAYRELAEMYPRSPRLALYASKRDSYAQRVVDRDAARLAARTRAASRPARRSRSCCKYCSAGKPCGDSCISRSYNCNKGPGCAC
ncbi:hypothetical protein [Rubrivirga sp. IMCC45206]|uniref:hypothetical protein n=1 Tax=Rubrivirga sp. IMCC45206 TaxID=3391614 RepID=UPI00398F98B5